VSIERSDASAVSPAVIIVGTALVVFGFLIYYFMPLALLSFNLGLLLQARVPRAGPLARCVSDGGAQMFFFLLLGMLLGLVLLALNLENVAEKVVAFIFLFWESSYIFSIGTTRRAPVHVCWPD
jgi:hypothetical protein